MFRFEYEGSDIFSIWIGFDRVGSAWKNRDNSISIKIEPEFYNAPYKISETESHQHSYETFILLRNSASKVKK